MLAQNFMSAKDLRISSAEQQALIKVLGMLERGDLVHARQKDKLENGYCQSSQGEGCGTPACIGGWVAHLLDRHQLRYVDSHIDYKSSLYELYWGNISPATTPAQAATALRSFLVTGNPKWNEATA